MLGAGRYTSHCAARCLMAWRAEAARGCGEAEFSVGVKDLGLQGLGRAQEWAGPSDQWELCQPCPCPREPVNEKPPTLVPSCPQSWLGPQRHKMACPLCP